MIWVFYKPKFEYEAMYLDLGGPWSGHKYFSYDLVKNLKPKKIVELGVHLGCSLFSFSQAIKDEGGKAHLDGIDTWQGDKHSGHYDEIIFKRVNEIKNACYPKTRINFIRKTFDKANCDYPDKSIDLLHIDGLHTYKAVKKDFDNWLGKVKDDGIILLHDIAVEQWGFGIYKLWKEIKKKYKTIEFTHSFGLGVIFKNPKTYKKLIIPNIETFSIYYPLLAEKEELKWQLGKAQEEIIRYENTINRIRSHPLFPVWKIFKKIKDNDLLNQ